MSVLQNLNEAFHEYVEMYGEKSAAELIFHNLKDNKNNRFKFVFELNTCMEDELRQAEVHVNKKFVDSPWFPKASTTESDMDYTRDAHDMHDDGDEQ